MSQSRLEWKVGLFVLVGLALLAALLIKFSKGVGFSTPSYELILRTGNVGGIKRGAAVLMAGVPIGSVQGTDLSRGGRIVVVHLRILKRYLIATNAVFEIEQAGFLGDQYISITPPTNLLTDLNASDTSWALPEGASVTCEEPFNLQQTARAAAGFLRRIDDTTRKLNEAITRLDTNLLAPATLEHMTVTVANFRHLSDRALDTMSTFDGLLDTNAPGITRGVSNLVVFSDQLNRVARDLEQTVTTNRGQFTTVVKNIDSLTRQGNNLLTDLQAGKGLAGSMLKDTQMQAQAALMISNLTVVSSNLARFGLLYKPRQVKPRREEALPLPGKAP